MAMGRWFQAQKNPYLWYLLSCVSIASLCVVSKFCPDSILTNDWLATTEEQFDTFQGTSYYRLLLHQQAPRPEPLPDTTKNGEQSPILGALDVFGSFDVGTFEAIMICSKKPA